MVGHTRVHIPALLLHVVARFRVNGGNKCYARKSLHRATACVRLMVHRKCNLFVCFTLWASSFVFAILLGQVLSTVPLDMISLATMKTSVCWQRALAVSLAYERLRVAIVLTFFSVTH